MSVLEVAGLLPQLGDLTPHAAERWIAAALAQSVALHEHDAWLYPTDPGRQSGAERLHDAWRHWADDAEALVRQAEVLQSPSQEIVGLDQLRDAVGRIQAVIKMSPATIARRRQQAQNGEVYPVEEVRRELRAGIRR